MGLAITTLAATLAAASEEDAATIRTYCEAQPNASARICNCLLGRFEKLSEGQQAFVVAIVEDDQAVLADLRAELPPMEVSQAETFLKAETMLCRPSG